MLKIFVPIIFLLYAPHARAEDLLTNQGVFNACESEDIFDSGFCFGTVMAYAQLATTQCTANQSNGGSFLYAAELPEGVTNGALVQTFKNWAEKNPQEWHRPSLLGVLSALSEAFPCSTLGAAIP